MLDCSEGKSDKITTKKIKKTKVTLRNVESVSSDDDEVVECVLRIPMVSV